MGVVDGVDLGRFGVWTFDFEGLSASRARETVQELEELGWQSFWFPELFGREALTHAGLLLAVTERITIVNGIAKIWFRDPRWTQAGAMLERKVFQHRMMTGQ